MLISKIIVDLGGVFFPQVKRRVSKREINSLRFDLAKDFQTVSLIKPTGWRC